MTMSTDFCPACGAANDSARTHCFACEQLLASGTKRMPDEVLLVGRYQLGTVAGSGGFSTVYRARDEQEGGRDVALKQINLQGLSAEATIEAPTRLIAKSACFPRSLIPRCPASTTISATRITGISSWNILRGRRSMPSSRRVKQKASGCNWSRSSP
jgi:serine/threonine protein kinase